MGIDENSPCIIDWPRSPENSQEEDMFSEIDWIPAQRVHLKPGITVRVQKNAYANTPGLSEIHAGRVGVIQEITGGDVVVKTTDNRSPALNGAHYSPWVLEMLLDDCLPTKEKK